MDAEELKKIEDRLDKIQKTIGRNNYSSEISSLIYMIRKDRLNLLLSDLEKYKESKDGDYDRSVIQETINLIKENERHLV